MDKITVKNIEINVTGIEENDFVSLTDMAKIKNPEFHADVIKNWMRLRSTIEFLGIWEQINNPDFNMVEFDQFKNESGHVYFVMTPTKWVKNISYSLERRFSASSSLLILCRESKWQMAMVAMTKPSAIPIKGKLKIKG